MRLLFQEHYGFSINSLLKKFIVLSCVFFLAGVQPAQAIVLFQDDTFDEVRSSAILIGSNDAGAANTAIQFGNDVTSSENGNITWNISTNTFNFDHSIDITGGATVSGTATLNGTTNLNGAAALGDGGDDISINSNDWDISSAGVGSGFTGFSSSGTVTSSGNLSVTGTASIGDGGDDISIDTNDWDISSAGVASGFTGMTSTGAINYTGATYQGPQGAADPGTCSVGNYFYNTTSSLLKICTATNTWSPLLRSDTSQSFTSGTLTFNSGTTLAGNGAINFTAATSFRPPQGSADPGTCSVGQEFYNTTSNAMKVCTATNTWTIAVSPNGADLLDGVDGGSFLRSDASDNYTSGTLTTDNGTTLTVNGVANLGDGGDDININSNDWDVSSAGVASGFTGFTSTGTVNLSGAGSLRIREAADEATSACTTVKEILLDTTENRAYVCTVTGSPGTWVGIGAGDAGTLDTVDSTSFLRSDTSDNFTSGTLTTDNGTTLTINGVANIGDNGDAITVNSNTWDISGAGVGSGFTGFTSSGTVSSTGALSVTGSATIGDNGDDISIDTNDWDISSAGVGSGFTGFTSTGTVNLSGATSVRLREVANEATATCTTVKEVVVDTTENKIYICTAVGSPGTWNTLPAANPAVSAVTDSTITSATPGSPAFGTEIEILTPTNPTVTPDNVSQRVLINGSVQFVNPASGDDNNASVRIRIRRGSGGCTGTQVGPDLTSVASDPRQTYWISFSLVDSPATTSAQAYTVCSAQSEAAAASANATTPIVTMTIQQVAP